MFPNILSVIICALPLKKEYKISARILKSRSVLKHEMKRIYIDIKI